MEEEYYIRLITLPGDAGHLCGWSETEKNTQCCQQYTGARHLSLPARVPPLLLGGRWYPSLCPVPTVCCAWNRQNEVSLSP